MSGADKEVLSHEVGLDASNQDERDMERLGKVQQLKVCLAIAGTRGARTDD